MRQSFPTVIITSQMRPHARVLNQHALKVDRLYIKETPPQYSARSAHARSHECSGNALRKKSTPGCHSLHQATTPAQHTRSIGMQLTCLINTSAPTARARRPSVAPHRAPKRSHAVVAIRHGKILWPPLPAPAQGISVIRYRVRPTRGFSKYSFRPTKTRK